MDIDVKLKSENKYVHPKSGLIMNKLNKIKLKYFAEGAVSKVYTYIDPVDHKKYIFKQSIDDINRNDFSNIFIKFKREIISSFVSVNSGIPKGDKANFCSRSIASTITDEMLNGEDRILVKTEYIHINGMLGIKMELAEGKSPILKKEKIRDIEDSKCIRWAQQNNYDLIAKKIKCHYRQIILEGTYLKYCKKYMKYLNKKNPITYESFLILQIVDILNGECDRHSKNYLINQINGKVKGIDNEYSFGIYSIPKEDVRNQPKVFGILPNRGSLMLRMPPVITIQIKNNITSLYNNSKEYCKRLSCYLTKNEVKATIVRLNKLYEHINSDKCEIVNNTEELFIRGKEIADTTNSYWARELYASKINPTNWNHLREQK
jgi:hypothetical protein